jgi:transketolase
MKLPSKQMSINKKTTKNSWRDTKVPSLGHGTVQLYLIPK